MGVDVETGVHAALCHYAGKLESGRAPVGPPQFLQDQGPGSAETSFELAVDPEVEAVLEREAARQGMSTSRLALHSVLVYLAELDFLSVPPRAGAAGPQMH
jgi:hypothetical protein